MFKSMSEKNSEGMKSNKGFENLSASLYSMFVAGTTDDFVGVLLPTFIECRISGILWLVFLLIVQVLLLNLVLDTLVGAYRDYTEECDEKCAWNQVLGIKKAFRTLKDAT